MLKRGYVLAAACLAAAVAVTAFTPNGKLHNLNLFAFSALNSIVGDVVRCFFYLGHTAFADKRKMLCNEFLFIVCQSIFRGQHILCFWSMLELLLFNWKFAFEPRLKVSNNALHHQRDVIRPYMV